MKGQRRLVVLEQPAAEFYKDEGGKSNCLTMRVGSSTDEVPCTVPLKCTLYFESENPVEDWDQSILQLMCPEFEQYALSEDSPSATIEFRLEKVSRRKDGQRFKVFVEPDRAAIDHCPDDLGLRGCFTQAIAVMSKRRTGERVVTRRATPRAASELQVPEELLQSIADVGDNVSEMRDTLDMLVRTVQGQTERIMSLEQTVRQLSERPGDHLIPRPASTEGGASVFDRRNATMLPSMDAGTSFRRGKVVPFTMDSSQFDGGRFREGMHPQAPSGTDDTAETDVPPDLGGVGAVPSGRFSSSEVAATSMMHRRSTAERLLSADLGLAGDGLSILGSSAAAVSSSNEEPPAKRARLKSGSRGGMDYWLGNGADFLGRIHSGPLQHTFSTESAPLDDLNERS